MIVPQYVTLSVLCQVNGDPDSFRLRFDNWLRSHTRPEDPVFEVNKAVLEIKVLSVCAVEEGDD
jgi:hypothetical protein